MKALKIIIVLAIVLVLVAGGAIAAFVAFADPNDFKEEIAARVFEQTGRALTLDGDLEWGFWPQIRLKAGPMALSNAEGFGDQPFVAADEIQIAVATLPLLRRQIEMDTVKLYGARVNLARNAEGVTNWADLAGDGEQETRSGDMAAIALGGVDVRDAAITWRDATTGQNAELKALKVATGALTFGEPIAFELSFSALANEPAVDSDVALTGTVAYDLGDETYHIEPLDLAVMMRGKSLPGGKTEVKSSAVVDVDLDAGTARISGLNLDGLGASLKGDIEAMDIESENPGARGTVALDAKDLGAIFGAFELPVADQIKGLKDRSASFTTEFDADMASGNVNVPKLEGAMLGATLSANLEAERANTDEPAARGSIATAGPDLPSLLAVIGQLQGMEAGTLNKLVKVLRGAKDRSFDVQSSFDADMKSGQINLPKLEARLLGNTISGNVTSSSSGGDASALNGTIRAAGPDLPSLLAIAATFQGPDSGLHETAESLAGTRDKSFTLDGSFTADTGSGKLDLPRFSAKGLGLTIDGKLAADNLERDDGRIDGTFAVDGDRVGPLLTALGQKGLGESVRSLKLNAGVSGTMSDMTFSPLRLTAAVRGKGQSKPVNVNLAAGEARANLTKETLNVKELRLNGLGMDLRGNVAATKIKSEPAFEGNVAMPAFNLRNVLRALNQDIPRMANRNALTKFAVNTGFKGTSNSIAFDGLSMTLDQSTLKGTLAVKDFEGPNVEFGLGIDRINADDYMAPEPKGKRRPVTPESAAAGAATLPVETLRKLVLNGDLIIGSLQISGAKMRDVKMSVNAKGGRIRAKPVAASLYNGTYDGVVNLNATKNVPVVAIQSTLKNVAIEPLLYDMTGDRSISGTANLTMNLKTSGNDGDRMKKTLTGPLKFSVLNGVYRGMDVARMLQQIEVMIESKVPTGVQSGGETRFQSLTGTVNFKNGVGTNDDLLLDGSGFRITGKGIVANLHDDTMKYDAKVSVGAASAQRGESNYNLGGYDVPIRCRGPLGADACKPDVGDIVAAIGANAVKKEVGKQIEKALGGDTGKALRKLLDF